MSAPGSALVESGSDRHRHKWQQGLIPKYLHDLSRTETGGWHCRHCCWTWARRPHRDGCPGLYRFRDWEDAWQEGLFSATQLRQCGYRAVGEPQGTLYVPAPNIGGSWVPLYTAAEATPSRRRGEGPRIVARWWVILGTDPHRVLTVTRPVMWTRLRDWRERPDYPRAPWLPSGILTDDQDGPVKVTICPAPETEYRRFWLAALPMQFDRSNPPSIFDCREAGVPIHSGLSAAVWDGPYDSIEEILGWLHLLPLELPGRQLPPVAHIIPYMPWGMTIGADGRVFSPVDRARYPDLGDYDWGTPLQRLLRRRAWWVPQALIADWEPHQTRNALSGETLSEEEEAFLQELAERGRQWAKVPPLQEEYADMPLLETTKERWQAGWPGERIHGYPGAGSGGKERW